MLAAALSLVPASPAGAVVWWASVDDNAIGRTNLDGSASNPRFIVLGGPLPATGVPAGLAVNAQHVYWSTYGLTIGRADLDGSDVVPRFVDIGLDPSGMAIDQQYIYWAWGHSIGRARLDGSQVQPDFITVTSTPCGVAVDDEHIYWGDSGALGLGRANLDGTGVELAFTPATGGSCGVAVNDTHVFWGNSSAGTIGRANLDGTGNQLDFIRSGSPCGVAVNATHVFWTSFNGSLGRANLDGTGITSSLIPAHAGCAITLDQTTVPTITVQRSPDQIIFGQDIAFDVTVAGPGPIASGNVQFLINDEPDGPSVPLDTTGHVHYSPTFLLGVGDVVRATYGGDANYAPSEQDISPIVQPAPTSTVLVVEPGTIIRGNAVSATVAVRNTLTGVTPLGSVQFDIDGIPLGTPLELDDNGEVAVGLTADVPPADYTVTARYADDLPPRPYFLPSSASQVVRVAAPPAPPAGPAPPRNPSGGGTNPTVVRKQSLTALATALIKRLTARGFPALTEPASYTAPGPGTLTQRIYARGAMASRAALGARQKLIASGRRVYSTAARGTMRPRLTSTGRRVVKRAKRLRLRIVTAFAPVNGTAVSTTQRATIRRRSALASASGWSMIELP